MQAAMHIGIFVIGRLDHAVDDLAWLLRRSSIIEIDERLAIDLRRQDREILAEAHDIERRFGNMLVHRPAPRVASQAAISARNFATNASFGISSASAPPKASSNSAS